MTAIPERPQRSLASFPALLWLSWWVAVAFGMAVFGHLVGFLVFLVLAFAGWWSTHEGPAYLVGFRKVRFRLRKWRLGNAYRRSISSAEMVLHRGVSPLKGLFRVEIVLLTFKVAGDLLVRMPALLNGHRHTIMVESGTNPISALADEEEREIQRRREANLYTDLAEVLGEGNAFTVWSLHRRPDESADNMYLSERAEPTLPKESSSETIVTREDHVESRTEIMDGNWDRRQGISLTATNPSSWKQRRLDGLTAKQLMQSPAVKAAQMIEGKMEGAGITDARVCSYPSFRRLLREIFSVKNLELYRERARYDIIADTLADAEDEPLDTSEMFTADETPLPTMQREIGNDYMIFDGTYHRVLWITNFSDASDYDALHTANCDYFVSTYCDIWLARDDDSRRQDKRRLISQWRHLVKRNVSAEEEQELEMMDDERFDALEYGRYVIYFRTIVIVSGNSLDDLEENEGLFMTHLARSSVRVQLRTVTGPDQLSWFFAALGSYGVTR